VGRIVRYSRLGADADLIQRALRPAAAERPSGGVRHRRHLVASRLGPEAIRDIVDRYSRGVPALKLADEYGISPWAVRSLRADAGVELQVTRVDQDIVREAVRLYESGQSLASVGQRLGRSPSTINRVLSQQGVALRGRHERVCRESTH